MYSYQNQSIGRELTASDINCEITLSLKTSDMIKRQKIRPRERVYPYDIIVHNGGLEQY